jgi:hypothetical protein
MVWVVAIVGVLALKALSDDYMMSPETSWRQSAFEYATVAVIGFSVWYAIYRLTRWFDERS